MSDITKAMEQFITNTRYTTLTKFCEEFRDLIKAYVVRFETHAEAKASLKNKFKLAFFAAKKDSRRGPGYNVDIQDIFAEAKAERKIFAEGWSTLSSAVARTGSQMRKGLEGGLSDESESEEDGDDDCVLESKFNVSASFKQYQAKCRKVAKQEGFYVDGNLHQILSLSHVLLLKENENPESLVECFGLENLNNLHQALRDKYTDKDAKVTTSTFNEVTNALRGLCSRTKRRHVKKLINEAAKNASDEDDKLIDIILNCLNKLPAQERIGDDVGEAELIGSYLDPIISPLFHDPENSRQFRWLNTGVEDTEARRPDGNMEQRQFKFSTGYIEVNPQKHQKTHEDTLRLANFCKDTIDKQNIKTMIAIQAVGFHVSIYVFSLEAAGLYFMTELFSFNAPKCISELPMFVMNFDPLKQIMISHEKNGIFSSENRTSKKRPSIKQQSIHEDINIKKPKRLQPSLCFK